MGKKIMLDENQDRNLSTGRRKHNVPSVEEVQALDGMLIAMLNERERTVLEYFRNQGRKHGVSVTIVNEADPELLARAKSKREAEEIMKSVNSKIFINIS